MLTKQLMQESKVYTFYDFDEILYELKKIDKENLLHFDITKQEVEEVNQTIPIWVVSVITG